MVSNFNQVPRMKEFRFVENPTFCYRSFLAKTRTTHTEKEHNRYEYSNFHLIRRFKLAANTKLTATSNISKIITLEN